MRHLNPLPGNLEQVLRSYERVLVPGDEHGPALEDPARGVPVDVESYTKVDGLPIFTRDVMEQVEERLG